MPLALALSACVCFLCARDEMMRALSRPKQGKCLYYREWNRPQNTLENADDEGEEQRLMFGMLYSLKVSQPASHQPPLGRGAPRSLVLRSLPVSGAWMCYIHS